MTVSLPVVSLAQKKEIQQKIQKECFFPVTYSINRSALNMLASSGFPISGLANSQEKWITMSYTPPTAVGIIGISYQGFYFHQALQQYAETSLGVQISYLSNFLDTTNNSLVDTGNIIFWDEFAYGFENNPGPGVNLQRYSYQQVFNPYTYFVPAGTNIYIYPYIRIPPAYHATAVIEQSVTLHLVTTNRTT